MASAYLTGGAIALGIIVGIVLLVLWVAMWQDRIEHTDSEKTTEEEWAESRFPDLPRTEFVLCRIVPAGGWTLAEYIFQREDRSELARFIARSRARATISFGGCEWQQYIQAHSSYAGKVGGAANNSIVLRDQAGVVAEIFPQRRMPPAQYRLRWRNQEFRIEIFGWVMPQGRVYSGDKLVARFGRSGGFSRKILASLSRDLPDECKACLCSLALLQ